MAFTGSFGGDYARESGARANAAANGKNDSNVGTSTTTSSSSYSGSTAGGERPNQNMSVADQYKAYNAGYGAAQTLANGGTVIGGQISSGSSGASQDRIDALNQALGLSTGKDESGGYTPGLNVYTQDTLPPGFLDSIQAGAGRFAGQQTVTETPGDWVSSLDTSQQGTYNPSAQNGVLPTGGDSVEAYVNAGINAINGAAEKIADDFTNFFDTGWQTMLNKAQLNATAIPGDAIGISAGTILGGTLGGLLGSIFGPVGAVGGLKVGTSIGAAFGDMLNAASAAAGSAPDGEGFYTYARSIFAQTTQALADGANALGATDIGSYLSDYSKGILGEMNSAGANLGLVGEPARYLDLADQARQMGDYKLADEYADKALNAMGFDKDTVTSMRDYYSKYDKEGNVKTPEATGWVGAIDKSISGGSNQGNANTDGQASQVNLNNTATNTSLNSSGGVDNLSSGRANNSFAQIVNSIPTQTEKKELGLFTNEGINMPQLSVTQYQPQNLPTRTRTMPQSVQFTSF